MNKEITKRLLMLLALAGFSLSVSGCLLAAAGAGAAAGYEARKAGYRVQSPVTKEGEN